LVGVSSKENDKEKELLEMVIKLAKERPKPVVIPPPPQIDIVAVMQQMATMMRDTTKEIGEALAKSLVGYGQTQTQQPITPEQIAQALEALGDPDGFELEDKGFIPDIEKDEWMSPDLPEDGEWSAHTHPMPTDTPTHETVVTPMGTRVIRRDGSPMYGAAGFGMPSRGGVE
jgi:hypothetical protein